MDELSNFEQIRPGLGGKIGTPVVYRFVIRSRDAIEALGDMPLEADDDARLFGSGIIHDLMENEGTRYATSTMDILQGERVIASVPFGPEGSALSGAS